MQNISSICFLVQADKQQEFSEALVNVVRQSQQTVLKEGATSSDRRKSVQKQHRSGSRICCRCRGANSGVFGSVFPQSDLYYPGRCLECGGKHRFCVGMCQLRAGQGLLAVAGGTGAFGVYRADCSGCHAGQDERRRLWRAGNGRTGRLCAAPAGCVAPATGFCAAACTATGGRASAFVWSASGGNGQRAALDAEDTRRRRPLSCLRRGQSPWPSSPCL